VDQIVRIATPTQFPIAECQGKLSSLIPRCEQVFEFLQYSHRPLYALQLASHLSYRKDYVSTPAESAIHLEQLKKYIRLSLHIDFSFVFELNLAGNVVGHYGIPVPMTHSVERFYSHFYKEFQKKVAGTKPKFSIYCDDDFNQTLRENKRKLEICINTLRKEETIAHLAGVAAVVADSKSPPKSPSKKRKRLGMCG